MSMERVGAQNGRARLTEEKVRQVWALLVAEKTEREIAAEFGVSPVTIHDIAVRKTWTHLNLTRPLSDHRTARNSGRPWTPTELRFLEEHPEMPRQIVQRILGRPEASVRKRSGKVRAQN